MYGRLTGTGSPSVGDERSRKLARVERSEVVEAEALGARAAEVAAQLAALPTKAIGMTKRLLERGATAPLDDQLEWEAQLQSAAVKSADFAEGVQAFLEKRTPDFKGR